jgi:hypothetical protein
MTTEQKLAIVKDRLVKLQNSQKNSKCPGVVKNLQDRLEYLKKLFHKIKELE